MVGANMKGDNSVKQKEAELDEMATPVCQSKGPVIINGKTASRASEVQTAQLRG